MSWTVNLSLEIFNAEEPRARCSSRNFHPQIFLLPMGRHEFSKVPTCPIESDMVPAMDTRRRRPFSRFELCLLVPLTVFAAALAVFTVVYIVQHHGVIKPAAIAALCCTSFLLLGVGYVVSRRLQRPDWNRDLESGSIEKWQISAPVSVSHRGTQQTTFDSKGFYAVIPDSRPSSPGASTLSRKVRLAVKKTFSSSVLSRSSLEGSGPATAQRDRDSLIGKTPDGDDRCSTDESEDESGEGLWTSVFELAGDARLEQLRRANLKRLSRESRQSRYEMSGWDGSADKPQEPAAVRIVVTRPEPIASRDRRESWSDVKSLREVSLLFDPLRANPVRLNRDPSIRQTKSAHDLPSLLQNAPATPALRRPRSVEPGRERSQLELDQSNTQKHHKNSRLLPVAPSLPASQVRTGYHRAPAGRTPRGLRKLPNPSEHDLREVFRSGDGVSR